MTIVSSVKTTDISSTKSNIVCSAKKTIVTSAKTIIVSIAKTTIVTSAKTTIVYSTKSNIFEVQRRLLTHSDVHQSKFILTLFHHSVVILFILMSFQYHSIHSDVIPSI